MKTISQRFTTTVIGVLGLSSISLSAMTAPNLTDQLLATLLDRHTTPQLYQQANNPWPGGNYTFDVLKNGKPLVTSGENNVRVKMPLKFIISGDAASNLLKFKMNCNATFTTLGEVEFTPRESGSMTELRSQITLPIPAVIADCDNMQLPIDPYLKTLFEQNKRHWEAELDTKVNAWLAGAPHETPASDRAPAKSQ